MLALLCGLAIQGITFASKPGDVFIPVREAAANLGWNLHYDAVLDLASLNGTTLDPRLPRLSDGTILISIRELANLGARPISVTVGDKRVVVDLTTQTLRAWQGARLVYRWRISTGREGKETPTGSFKAGDKERMHISTLYGSPMPFSVHVTGNIFIHGSDRFTGTPGSHGCIRLPIMEARNIAEEFYNWIDVGVPIRIEGSYSFFKTNS